MKNLKLKIIQKYLKPYKKEFLYGAIALLIVNILSVVIPLEVKRIIDELQNCFTSNFVNYLKMIYFLRLEIFGQITLGLLILQKN